MKKDTENESIGIIAIIAIVVLAIVGLYFLFSHQHSPALKGEEKNLKAPVEVPSPTNSNQGQNEFQYQPGQTVLVVK